MDDLGKGLERERPEVLEALRSMNWEERLEKARQKRTAALARNKGKGAKGAVVRGVDAEEMLRRTDPVDLDPGAPDNSGFPAPIDERTLRGQRPAVASILDPRTISRPDEAPISLPLVVPQPSQEPETEADAPVRAAPRAGRGIAGRVGAGFGFGLGIGMSLVLAGMLFLRDGEGTSPAQAPATESPVASFFPPVRPIPALPSAGPDVPLLDGSAAISPAAAFARLPEAPTAGLPPATLPVGVSPGLATAAPDVAAEQASPVDSAPPDVAWVAPERSQAASLAPEGLGIVRPSLAAALPSVQEAPRLGAPAGESRTLPFRSSLPAPALAALAPMLEPADLPAGELAFAMSRAVDGAPAVDVAVAFPPSAAPDTAPGPQLGPSFASPDVSGVLAGLKAPATASAPPPLDGPAVGPPVARPEWIALARPAGVDVPKLSTAMLAPPDRPVPPPEKPEEILPGADRVRVSLNAPQTVPDGDVDSVAAGLAEAGVTLFNVRRVPFKVSQTQIRYFHTEDAAPARALAELFGGRARDFTSFRPEPPDGTLEVYLAGERAAPPPRTARPARTPERARPSEADLLRDRIVQRLRRGDHL